MITNSEFLRMLSFVALVCALISGLLTYQLNTHYWCNSAVEAGVAEYYLDQDNYRQWRWITPEQEPEDD